MLLAGRRAGGQQNRRRRDAGLEIAENILSDEAIGALLDEWIVPAIVDGIIRDLHGQESRDLQRSAIRANEGNET